MKNKHLYLIAFLVLSASFTSCESLSNRAEQRIQNKINNIQYQAETAILDAVENLTLNNGKKWLVNSEMMPYINKGKTLANDFVSGDMSSFKTLANQLEKTDQQLIQSCTMKGKSHDALHKWLHPHMELVQKLKTENDPTKANQLVQKINASYQNFGNYFQ